jgi:hypothetical protein
VLEFAGMLTSNLRLKYLEIPEFDSSSNKFEEMGG